MTDFLSAVYPRLTERLPKIALADLPTPVSSIEFETPAGTRRIAVKHDDRSNAKYGGNKIRKLEYLLHRARERGARRIATFGAVGSNHALATAIFSHDCGFDCTCFLGAQKPAPGIGRTLNMHRRIGTEIVRFGTSVDQLAVLRRYLHGRRAWVVPLGGSSWLGAVGFVAAGVELAHQVDAGEAEMPARIYIANGTMGSSVGLALGLALADMPTEVNVVRVVDDFVADATRFARLLRKTSVMLQRIDPSIPEDIADRVNVCWRDDFFAGGYAVVDDVTREAVAFARQILSLELETTYTGKAMAALLHDLAAPTYEGEHCLFWNTYNSRPLPVDGARPATRDNIPREFMTYYD